jgi:hypothetical protein
MRICEVGVSRFGKNFSRKFSRIFAVKFFQHERGIAAGGSHEVRNHEELSLRFPYKFCEADNLSVGRREFLLMKLIRSRYHIFKNLLFNEFYIKDIIIVDKCFK